jgi:hypothetical protein
MVARVLWGLTFGMVAPGVSGVTFEYVLGLFGVKLGYLLAVTIH